MTPAVVAARHYKKRATSAMVEQPEEVPPALEIVQAEWELLPNELEGTSVDMRAADGYVNATVMCRAAGKQFSEFARLASVY